MTIAKTVDLVVAAKEAGYAVPAVNIVDDLSLRAVVAAAEEAQSPVIIQTSVKTVKSIGAPLLSSIFSFAADAVSVPVSLHLDHCPDRSFITLAIENGWSSVLFDASDRELEQAWQETKEVVAEAHAKGVGVECEIENIVGVEDGVGSDEPGHAYSSEQLVEVVTTTGADLLAPQLGTAHGLYKASPVLLFDRVTELGKLSPVPVVLHGGTGLTDDDFRRFITNGVAKVNLSTTLKLTYMRAAQAHIAQAETKGKWEPVKMFDDITAAVKATVREHMDQLGSTGKAKAAPSVSGASA
jgi:ketose-bisphosphate aldolase